MNEETAGINRAKPSVSAISGENSTSSCLKITVSETSSTAISTESRLSRESSETSLRNNVPVSISRLSRITRIIP